jgi:hypothetical protein
VTFSLCDATFCSSTMLGAYQVASFFLGWAEPNKFFELKQKVLL